FVVNLHLRESGLLELRHRRAPLFGSIGPVDAERSGAAAVDQSGENQFRSDRAVVDSVSNCGHELEFSSAIASRRDAGGKICGSVFDLREVRMHFPKPGKQRFSAAVDGPNSRRGLADASNLSAADDNGGIWNGAAAAIDQQDARDRKR